MKKNAAATGATRSRSLPAASPARHATPADDGLSQPEQVVVVTSTMPDHQNSNAVIRRYAADGLRAANPALAVWDVPLETAVQVIAAVRPSLVIAIGGVAIDGNELRELGHASNRARAPLAVWLHDDPYELDYAFRAEAVADVIFTNDSWARFHYRHPHVHHLPLAADPGIYHRPIGDEMRRIEMFFCGHAHPNRIRFFKEASAVVARFAVTLNGTGWPADLVPAVNRRLAPTEVAATAQRALTTLYLPRDHNIANRRFDLPSATPGPRLFEVALAGSAQLVWDDSPEITDYFEPGREIILVEGMADLARTLERTRDEPGHFLAVARAAQRRALAEHCYQHRMQVLLQKVAGHVAVGEDTAVPVAGPVVDAHVAAVQASGPVRSPPNNGTVSAVNGVHRDARNGAKL